MNVEFHGPYYNLHNLGGAHGIPRFTDFSKFVTVLTDLVNANTKSDNFVCVTNNGQTVERVYLKKIGFTTLEVDNLHVHSITRDQLLGRGASKKFQEEREAAAKLAEERAEERRKALAARPKNAEGRLLTKEGKVVRKPYEYFVGDRVEFREYSYTKRVAETKQGTVREILGKGEETQLKLRTKTIPVYRVTKILERAQ